jgi:hypothetical protein
MNEEIPKDKAQKTNKNKLQKFNFQNFSFLMVLDFKDLLLDNYLFFAF